MCSQGFGGCFTHFYEVPSSLLFCRAVLHYVLVFGRAVPNRPADTLACKCVLGVRTQAQTRGVTK